MSDAEARETETVSQIKYELTPRSLKEYLLRQMRLLAPSMIWGPMGIGKSDIPRQIALSRNARIVALHLPQFDPTDLKGIPVRLDNGTVKWVTSSFLPQHVDRAVSLDQSSFEYVYSMPLAKSVAVYLVDDNGLVGCWNTAFEDAKPVEGVTVDIIDPKRSVKLTIGSLPPGINLENPRLIIAENAILFLDELSAADPTVQNSALQLVLDRMVNEYIVPMGVPILAAGNRASDKAHIAPMPAPLANRFSHVRLIPSVEEWIEDYAFPNGVRADIIAYLEWKGKGALFHFNPVLLQEGDMGFRTPRSWTMLSRELPEDGEVCSQQVVNALIAGRIGCAAAGEFIAWRNSMAQLVKPDDLLLGRERELPELDLGQKWGMCVGLCEALSRFWNKHYDDQKKPTEQCQEWSDIGTRFMQITDKMLGREMTTYCIKVAKRLGVKMVHFRGIPYYGEFAKSYSNLVAATI